MVRVFDPQLKLSKEAMLEILKNAQLEEVGFKKSEESAIETDENGESKEKKTIHYMVKDDCSKVAFWEGVLEQRLPSNFLTSNIGSTFVREIQSRIKGRGTKYCNIGLEIHPRNECRPDPKSSRRPARSAGCWWGCCSKCCKCTVCIGGKIAY